MGCHKSCLDVLLVYFRCCGMPVSALELGNQSQQFIVVDVFEPLVLITRADSTYPLCLWILAGIHQGLAGSNRVSDEHLDESR